MAQVLAALAYHHPHQTVPFMKALLSTAAHIMKVTEKSGIEKYLMILYVWVVKFVILSRANMLKFRIAITTLFE